MEFDSVYYKYFLDYNIRMDISMYHSKWKVNLTQKQN